MSFCPPWIFFGKFLSSDFLFDEFLSGEFLSARSNVGKFAHDTKIGRLMRSDSDAGKLGYDR